MTRPIRHQARAGMTLMELVVALAITGMAVSAGYAAFGTLVDRRERAESRAGETATAAAVRSTLVQWLGAARLTIEEDAPFRGIDGTHRDSTTDADVPDDELTFFTTAATPLSSNGTIVRLSVSRAEGSADRGLVADLTEWRGTRTQRIPLAPGVTGLDARYLSGILGQRKWLPSWVSTTILPAGVQLTLSGATLDTLPPLLRVPLTVSLEGGR